MSTGPVELQGITINAGILETMQGFSTQRNVLKGVTIGVGLGQSFIQIKVVDRYGVGIENANVVITPGNLAETNSPLFDAVDDYFITQLQHPRQIVPTYPFTFECWFKKAATANQSLISLAHPTSASVYFYIGVSSGNLPMIGCANTSHRQAFGDTIIGSDWTHIAGVFASTTSRLLYVNGVPQVLSGAPTTAVNFNTATDRVLLGLLRTVSPTYWFGGQMSEVRIWQTARTEQQINDFMNTRLQSYQPGLTFYVPLLDGAGDFAQEFVLGNNPTRIGASWTSDNPLVLGNSPNVYAGDSGYTSSEGNVVLNYKPNFPLWIEVSAPGKRKFRMPFQIDGYKLLDWQVMLSDYLATFATDRGNILINSEPENNDANFLIE